METCEACRGAACARGRRRGAGVGFDHLVALAGNPNTGKSTVFNALTGRRQHTGNWPGKTVARAEGVFEAGGRRFRLIDLPGTYSLLSQTMEEEIARDFLLFGRPDVTVLVVDATNLERNLNLALQILEITDRAVICLNLMDEACRKGLRIEAGRLASELGVPVVPTAARSGEGLDRLVEVVEGLVRGEVGTLPRRLPVDRRTQAALDELAPLLADALPALPNTRWIALRLLEGDSGLEEALQNGRVQRWLDLAGREPEAARRASAGGSA